MNPFSLLLRNLVHAVTAVLMLIPVMLTMGEAGDPNTPVKTYPDSTNPYITEYLSPDIAAHRSGAGLAPQNTLMAFENIVGNSNSGADTLEFDVQITADGELVLMHDLMYDSITNAEEEFGRKGVFVSSLTLEEAQRLNLGENFEINGEYPYKGLRGDNIPENLRVVTCDRVIDYVEANCGSRKYNYVIEIKSIGANVEVWTKFTFPGRKGKYSNFIWDWSCFTGTDYDARTKQTKLLEFYSKKWSENVSQEQGNFDYIMGDDVDFSNQKVVDELYAWTRWYKNLTGIDGFRLDAVKSIDFDFFPKWLATMRQEYQDDLFAVGEYWSGNLEELKKYLCETSYCMALFDVPLHFHLFDASSSYDRYDMSKILEGTLTKIAPQSAVAFVDNHDTQPYATYKTLWRKTF